MHTYGIKIQISSYYMQLNSYLLVCKSSNLYAHLPTKKLRLSITKNAIFTNSKYLTVEPQRVLY